MNWFRFSFWMLLGVLLVVLVQDSQAATVLNVTAPAVQNFTYAVGNDSSDWLVLACELPVNWSNNTVVVNTSNASTVFQLQLDPGGVVNESGGSCVVNAACTGGAENVTPECFLDREIEPGYEIEMTGGACDISVRCEECDEAAVCDWASGNVTHLVGVEMRHDPDAHQLRFTIGEKPEQVFDTRDIISYDGELRLECPYNIRKDNFTGAELLSLCQETNPYLLEWLDLSLKQEAQGDTELTECELRLSQAERECEAAKRPLGENLAECRAERGSTQEKYEDCISQQARIEDNRFIQWAAVVVTGLFLVMSLLGNAALGYALAKQRGKRGDF